MKAIKSINLLLCGLVIAAVMITPRAQAAAIALEGRNELVALYITMFNAAPDATALSEMVAQIDSGKKLVDVAQTLTSKTNFANHYPGYLTSDEFADKLVASLLGTEVSSNDSDWAKTWIKGQLQAGKSVASVITSAVQAIRSTTNTTFLNAKTALDNRTTVALYYAIDKGPNPGSLSASNSSITSSAATVSAYEKRMNSTGTTNPTATGTGTTATTSATSTSDFAAKKQEAQNAFNELFDIAEDFNIEQEDNSPLYQRVSNSFFRQQVQDQSNTSTNTSETGTQVPAPRLQPPAPPSETLNKLNALKGRLIGAQATTELEEVKKELRQLQDALAPWVLFAETGGSVDITTGPKGPTDTTVVRGMNDVGLKAVRDMNDRVTAILTGGGGRTVTCRYDTNVHQTVCN